MMTDRGYRPSFGALADGRGRVRFRLWAPDQSAVNLEIEGRPSFAMAATGNGWFEVEADATPGTRYEYILSDGRSVPDPASRAQHEDVHGPSVVVDPSSYDWRQTEWRGRPWHESIIYELHVGAFGGFKGVERELPRLAELGITAIELMPVHDFPGRRNWGYDGVLPFAPDRAYGHPDDLKSLIDSAHALELNVLLDVVYNHFGPDGNYLALYAKEFFRDDVATPWGAAIDFRKREVRRYFIENVLQWLFEYRFDGLRFDAVHAITELDWLDEMAREVRHLTPPGRHISLVVENDGNLARLLDGAFDAQWNDDGHHVLHVLLTGESEGYYEDYVEDTTSKLARSLAEGFVYQGEWSNHRNAHRGTSSVHLPPTAFVLFLQNHDQIGNRGFGERLETLAKPQAIEAAISLLLLCPQIPLVFMGEELASRSPFLFFTDHHETLAEQVRKGRRREFSRFASFSDSARERIPDPNAIDTFRLSVPRPSLEAPSRTALYRRLLTLRRKEITPYLDGAVSIGAAAISHAAVQARWRLNDGAILDIACNLGPSDTALEQSGRVLFRSNSAAGSAVPGQGLPGYTTIVRAGRD